MEKIYTMLEFISFLYFLCSDPKNAFARKGLILRTMIFEHKQYDCVVARSRMMSVLVRRMSGTTFNKIIIRRIFSRMLNDLQPRGRVRMNFLSDVDCHKGITNSVNFHSRLPIFTTCGKDLTVNLWTIETNGTVNKLVDLQRHTTEVNSVSFCDWDIPFVLSAGKTETILWQMTPQYDRVERIATFHEDRYDGAITCAISHPTLPVIATFSKNAGFSIWKIDQTDLEKSFCFAIVKNPTSLVIFHPCMPILIEVFEKPGKLKFWDMSDYLKPPTIADKLRRLFNFRPNNDGLHCIEYSCRDKFVITSISPHPTIPILVVGDCSGKMLILDISKKSAPIESAFVQEAHPNYDPITSISFSKRSPIMVSTDENGSIRIWKLHFNGGKITFDYVASSRAGGSDLTDSSFHPWLNLAVVTSKTRKTVVFSIDL